MNYAMDTDDLHGMNRARQAFYAEVAKARVAQVPAMVDNVPFLSANEAEQLKASAKAALDRRVSDLVQRTKADIQSVGSTAEAIANDADQITAELHELMERAQSGQISYADYARQFEQLQAKATRPRRIFSETNSRLDGLEQREQDPLTAYLEMERKYPAMAARLGGPLR